MSELMFISFIHFIPFDSKTNCKRKQETKNTVQLWRTKINEKKENFKEKSILSWKISGH